MYSSFEQWTGRRELASFGTNSGSAAIPFQRWRHFKEAFAPEIVYEAVSSAIGPVKSCIDPFGGSGTSALACQFLGIEPTAIEVNPYLADLIEAKLTMYDAERLVSDLGAVLRLAGRMNVGEQIEALPPTFVEPGVASRWLFDVEVARRILAIGTASETLATLSHRRLFKVLLGGILVELSNAVVNGKGRRYRRNWENRRRHVGDVDAMFANAVSGAVGEIGRYGRRASSCYTVVRGDSRTEISGRGPFDLAVFSPPYPNSFDYTDVYNIELWMLGYMVEAGANRALRQRTLSSHVQVHRPYAPAPTGSQNLIKALELIELQRRQLWSPHIPAMLGAYFAEMLGILGALRSAMNPDGSIWAVVGDSRYCGVAVQVADILAELSPTAGFKVARLETLREMRASAQQGGQVQLAESLLVLHRA
ncbi:MAG: hypothetical protein ACKVON_15555 [Beijerinckiaceae bacterium]